jgi:hypothetical protein
LILLHAVQGLSSDMNRATPPQPYKNNCPWNASYLSTRHKYICTRELTLREMRQTANTTAPHSTTRNVRKQGQHRCLSGQAFLFAPPRYFPRRTQVAEGEECRLLECDAVWLL